MKNILMTEGLSVLLNYSLNKHFDNKELSKVVIKNTYLHGSRMYFEITLGKNPYILEYTFNNNHIADGVLTIRHDNDLLDILTVSKQSQIIRFMDHPKHHMDILPIGNDAAILVDVINGKKQKLALTTKKLIDEEASLFDITNDVAFQEEEVILDDAAIAILFMASGAIHQSYTNCQDVLRITNSESCHILVYGTIIRQIISFEFYKHPRSGRIDTVGTDFHRQVEFRKRSDVYLAKESISNIIDTSRYAAGKYRFTVSDHTIFVGGEPTYTYNIDGNNLIFEKIE